MTPRWTTARAVSGGAVLRLRVVSPTFSPEKLRIGRVVSSDLMVREREGEDLGEIEEVGLREKRGLMEWWD